MPPPTTIHHHQPKYIHHHPSPPITSQNISTTTHQPATIHPPPPATTQKMDCHPAKAKIYSYIAPFDIVLTVSFSSKCNIYVMEILCDKFFISSFSNSKFLLHFTLFKIFWSLYFKSLRLLNTSTVSYQERPIIIFI